MGLALTALIVGVLLCPLDAVAELASGLSKTVQLGVPATHRAGLEVAAQSSAHLRGPPDSETFLKKLRLVTTCCSEHSPQSQAHVVESTLEVLEALDWCSTQRQPNLDGSQGRIECGDMLGKARLRHEPSRGSSCVRLGMTVSRYGYSRYASTDMLRSRRRSASPLTRELHEIS